MMQLFRWILDHPVAIMIIVILMVCIGIYSFFHIPLEIRPVEQGGPGLGKNQKIRITARWHRQSPEAIMRQLTRPIEEVCMQLPEVTDVRSSSGNGLAYVTLEFPGKMDPKYIYISLNEKLSQLKRKTDFPRDAILNVQPLFADEEEQKQFRAPFTEIQINGPQSLNELRRLVQEQVVPLLKAVPGVRECNVFGGSDGFLQITLNPQQMEYYHITPQQVQKKLSEAFYYTGLGHITDGHQNHIMIFDSRPHSLNQLADVPIEEGIKLSDISQLSFDYAQPTTISRRNFMPLITVQIFKSPGVNALAFAQDIQQKLVAIGRNLPATVTLVVTEDQSRELRQELVSLGVRAAVILSVVFMILLLLFRRFFPSLVILMVIFLSFCSAAIFLYFSGYTINIITLAGIALVFGMLVDNAVVVVENIQHYAAQGKPVYRSALQGTLEIFQPLLASSITTILVFFALLLLEDRLGRYYQPMAYVLGFSLLTSLVLAVVLMPALFMRYPRRFATEPNKKYVIKGSLYENFLGNILHRPGLVLLAALMVFIAVVYFFIQNVNTGGFYYYQPTELETRIRVTAPKGVTLKTLDEIARSFETVVAGEQIAAETRTYINETDGYLHMTVSYDEQSHSKVAPYIVESKLIGQAVDYAGVGIYISGMFPKPFSNGGYRIYTQYNSQLQLIGPDYELLWQLGHRILALAHQDPRVGADMITPSTRNIWNLEAGEHHFLYAGDVAALWQRGLSIHEVYDALYQLFPATYWQDELIINENRYPLKLVYQTGLRELDMIRQSRLHLSAAQDIYFKDYIHPQPERKIRWIDKKNQQYSFTVAWEYRGTWQHKERHMQNLLARVSLPPGYRLEEQEWSFLTIAEKKALTRLIVVVAIGVFMILAALYESFWQPIIIFLSVPFALLGVFAMYLLFDRTFNANAYVGLILLLGIVVNDAIVLVERINQVRGKERTLKAALIRAGRERIRPIMITTVTTIGGLIPVFLLTGQETMLSQILAELSFIMIGGMCSSTLLTITLIPVIYLLLVRAQGFFRSVII